jgi:hypothetical protein
MVPLETPERPYPNLRQLLGCYFHEGWRTDGETADEVLARAVRETVPSDRAAARGELDTLLAASIDDVELGRILLSDVGVVYDPAFDGLTERKWLQTVQEKLRDGEVTGLSA